MLTEIELIATPSGEDFPPYIRRRAELFHSLTHAIDQSERALARNFRAFATVVGSKANVLALFAGERLDPVIEQLLGADLATLRDELGVALHAILEPVMALGGRHAGDEPALQRIVVDWDVQQPEAQRWLRSHALELVRDLDKTTRKQIAATIERGVARGQSVEQTAQDIVTVTKSMSQRRARLIAQTETIGAYAQGKLAYYKATGLVRTKRWQDGQAGACSLCRDLHGVVVPIDEPFPGGIQAPPRHAGCRCSLSAGLIDQDEIDAA